MGTTKPPEIGFVGQREGFQKSISDPKNRGAGVCRALAHEPPGKPKKSISEVLEAKWCREVIFRQKLFLLHIALGHLLKPQKTFQRGLGPVKGRKIGFRDLLFFRYAAFQWLLRKYVTKIGHYLETFFSKKKSKFFVRPRSRRKKKKSPKTFFELVYMKTCLFCPKVNTAA